MVLFKPFYHPDTNHVNTYMIGCSQTKQVFLVDAGSLLPEHEEFLQEKEAQLAGVFLTHSHWDHMDGLDAILDKYDVPVYSMNGETRNGQKVSEGESVPLGTLDTNIFKTTGHTPDGLTLYVNRKIAFVGDLIFAGSIGGTKTPEELEEARENIRLKIFSLPDDVLLCSGHGPMSTVYIERNYNPFFKF